MIRCFLIICLIIPAWISFKAQSLQTLETNPVIKIYRATHPSIKKSTLAEPVLFLPFFEDFSSFDVLPDPLKWSDQYAFINNSFAVDPVSIGVATLDAIDENGDIYSHNNLAVSSDRLTSQIFDLSAFSAGTDTVRLSFFYQAGGKGEKPESTDSLLLEFLTPSTNTWQTDWFALSDDFSQFRQVILSVPKSYYQQGFRFRFRNYSSISVNEVTGGRGALSNVDCWNIDYIQLNTSPLSDHLSINDIALVDQPRELIDLYETLPWLHLNDAQSITRNTMNYVVRNLEQGDSVNVGRNYYVKNLANGRREEYDQLFAELPPYAVERRSDPFFIPFTRLDNSKEGKLEVGAYLITPADQFKQNDTSRIVLNFKNYYAYDDGTPEYGFGISGESTAGALLAYKFRLFKADTLKAVDMLFNKTRDNYNADKAFYLCVWADQGGLPGDLMYISEETYTPGLYSGMPEFTRYTINAEPPLVISDTLVYVGWKQVTEDFLNLGYDVNRNNLPRTFVNISGIWFSPGNSLIPGSLMVRPVFGDRSIITGNENIPGMTPEIEIYPNPVSEKLFFNTEIEISSVRLIDIFGKTVAFENNPGDYMDVSTFPAGLYFLQLTTGDSILRTMKVIVHH